MSENSIYSDIARRTGGDIYIGVVGPVRTGKSTFIHRFLDSVVLPNISDEYDRQRTLDEIPQSASGRTIMTTEPKFVPDESVRITLGGTELNVKMVDCVGYMVEGALGAEEDGEHRMVMTPWSDKEMPFKEAAELGTTKVIGEHSTIAILVTTDGTISDIKREDYLPAEERAVKELKELGKPFAIILNSKYPSSEQAHELAAQLEEKYDSPVALVSCLELDDEDIKEILSLVLREFPVRSLSFATPAWCQVLPKTHDLRTGILDKVRSFAEQVSTLGDVERCAKSSGLEEIAVNAGDGTAKITIPIDKSEYYKFASESTGREITDEKTMLTSLCEFASIKDRWSKVEDAVTEAQLNGYGIVMPELNELKLDEPRLEKSSGGFGVRITAHADSVHMIKTEIRTDICPVIGSEEQANEVVKFLSEEYDSNPSGVWSYNMFGRSLYDMVKDGMASKLEHMPAEARARLGDTIGKIINEGSNGLICILL